jgi:hypothetical protein
MQKSLFFFNQKIDNSKSNNNNKSNSSQDIFNPKNMEYSIPIIPFPQILISDSQIVIPSSVLSSHSSPNIPSPTSPSIHSLIIDSNTTTQASNISKIFKLVSTPPLLLTPLLFPILTEEINNTNTNINSTDIQKNQ